VGKGRSGRRLVAVLAITGLGLTLTACGGDDDDDTPAAAATGGDTADDNDNADTADAGDTAEAEDNGDEDTITVDDINDIPDECLDIFGDFLKEIEPVVKDVDWENADLSAMEGIGSQLDSVASGMDDEMTKAGCDKYELSDDASLDTLIDIAKDKAPGTVAYFEFIKKMQESFADITVPPSDGGDTADDGGDNAGDTSDLPTDCDGAKDYIRGLMDKYDSMMDMPVSELTAVGTVTGTLTSACSPNDLQEFYGDPDVQAFMSASG
jgi:hypothetical protein